MSSVSGDVTRAAHAILLAGRDQQSKNLTVVHLVHGIADAADHVATNCGDVSAMALASVAIVESGRETMRETARTIDGLVETVAGVSSEISDLNFESQRIEDIIAIIADIARQTDLLALNASIEAARAGEAGKTFHVVAREIRELSLRTHTSLGHAQQRVEQVREKTARVCRLANLCATEARNGRRQVNEANASLEQVVEQLPHIARLAGELIQTSRQYSALSDDAASHIETVERMISANSTDLQRIDSLGQSLQSMALDLGASSRPFHFRKPPTDESKSYSHRHKTGPSPP
jgi:methyl-accepting chemotaxis protein